MCLVSKILKPTKHTNDTGYLQLAFSPLECVFFREPNVYFSFLSAFWSNVMLYFSASLCGFVCKRNYHYVLLLIRAHIKTWAKFGLRVPTVGIRKIDLWVLIASKPIWDTHLTLWPLASTNNSQQESCQSILDLKKRAQPIMHHILEHWSISFLQSIFSFFKINQNVLFFWDKELS